MVPQHAVLRRYKNNRDTGEAPLLPCQVRRGPGLEITGQKGTKSDWRIHNTPVRQCHS